MQAIAGFVGERLCHESDRHPLFLCNTLDQSLEQDRVIAGQPHVVYMVQIDLKLRRRELQVGGRGR